MLKKTIGIIINSLYSLQVSKKKFSILKPLRTFRGPKVKGQRFKISGSLQTFVTTVDVEDLKNQTTGIQTEVGPDSRRNLT